MYATPEPKKHGGGRLAMGLFILFFALLITFLSRPGQEPSCDGKEMRPGQYCAPLGGQFGASYETVKKEQADKNHSSFGWGIAGSVLGIALIGWGAWSLSKPARY